MHRFHSTCQWMLVEQTHVPFYLSMNACGTNTRMTWKFETHSVSNECLWNKPIIQKQPFHELCSWVYLVPIWARRLAPFRWRITNWTTIFFDEPPYVIFVFLQAKHVFYCVNTSRLTKLLLSLALSYPIESAFPELWVTSKVRKSQLRCPLSGDLVDSIRICARLEEPLDDICMLTICC